jgi:hypothetical protein
MARDCGLGVGTLVIIERARRRGRLAFLHLRFDLGGEFYHRDTSGGKAPRSARKLAALKNKRGTAPKKNPSPGCPAIKSVYLTFSDQNDNLAAN